MSLPTTQKAVVIQGPGVAKVVADRPIPKLRDGFILVKTAAVGLNPTDWKHIDHIVKEAGPVVGCDYAGVVEAVGPGVTKPFKRATASAASHTAATPSSMRTAPLPSTLSSRATCRSRSPTT